MNAWQPLNESTGKRACVRIHLERCSENGILDINEKRRFSSFTYLKLMCRVNSKPYEWKGNGNELYAPGREKRSIALSSNILIEMKTLSFQYIVHYTCILPIASDKIDIPNWQVEIYNLVISVFLLFVERSTKQHILHRQIEIIS